MLLDLEMWMPYDILNKADKMTMASSLELRVPYLDKEVFKVAQGCSDRLLVRGKTTKYALRTAASEEIGKEAAFRKKKGFPVPLRDWLRQEKYARILEIAFTGAIAREFLDTDLLLRLLSEHFEGRSDNTRVLYTVYAFITWYEVYFGQKEKIK
jgi:asparagine synthase (glutamine-hydrolysing)